MSENIPGCDFKKEDVLIINDKDFNTDNVCVITGVASGIGKATAIAAAMNGLTVLGLDSDEKGGRKTYNIIQSIGNVMHFDEVVLCDEENLEISIVLGELMLGRIKYLINIAGIQHIDSIENFPMETYDQMQDIMIRAPFYLSQLCIPYMKENGGGVVANMASIHSHVCTKYKSAYNIAKFALRGLTQSIAAEGGEYNIRSFSVSTGYVSTPLVAKQIPTQAKQRGITEDEVVSEVMMGNSRIKEMMSPIEVANLFIHGISKHGKYFVGNDILADGGVVLTY